MKKILVILLLMVYGFSSTGMTIQFHYCCGKLKNIEFTPAEQNACGKHHTDLNKKSCCESRFFEPRLSSDQNTSHFNPVFEQPAALPSFSTPSFKLPVADKAKLLQWSPPPPSGHIYVMNCVFRK